MGLDAHLRPKGERTSKTFFNGKRVKSKEYKYVEDLLSLIICDIVNGVQKSDILKKLEEGLYDGQKKKYTKRTAESYYFIATKRIKEDRETDIEELKDKLYSQYYSLFADALNSDNTLVAKQVLDSIAKVFLNNKNDVNISLDKSNDKIDITFGFE